MTYEILKLDGHDAIRCLRCGLISHHPEDVKQRYCAMCRSFHADDARPLLSTDPTGCNYPD